MLVDSLGDVGSVGSMEVSISRSSVVRSGFLGLDDGGVSGVG